MASGHDVFISYRREDGHSASHLFDSLRRKFPTFYDRQVGPGHVFTQEAQNALERAPVFIAVIGRGWMSAENVAQLQNQKDWVRREIEKALSRENVLLIPVRVDDVEMPKEAALPESLHPLLARQARHVRVDSWDHDIAVLEDEIKRHLKQTPALPPTRLSWPLGVMAVLLALITGAVVDDAWRRMASPPIGPMPGAAGDPLPSIALPPGEISQADLGIVAYSLKMTCQLAVERAQAGATIIFYNTFVRSTGDCEASLQEALRNKDKLQFLFIHPDSTTMAMRVAEFHNYPLVDYRRQFTDSLQMLARVRAATNAPDTAIQIRFYSNLPNMPIYIVEQPDRNNVIVHGYFLTYLRGSDDLPAVVLKRPSDEHHAHLFESLSSYVDMKWNNTSPAILDLGRLIECTKGQAEVTPWLNCVNQQIPLKGINGSGGVPVLQTAHAGASAGT
jgi:hypothetical protein